MKKNFLKIVLILGVFIFSLLEVDAAYNPYSQIGPYGTNCTWYAWQKAYEKGGVALAGFGNAKNWYNDAKNAGYSVGSTPRANSIIVWGQWTEYGHVGYVESVSGDTMYIWDSSRSCSAENDKYNACIKADEDIGLLSETTYQKCEPLKTPIPCQYKVNDRFTTGYIYLSEPRTNASNNNNIFNSNSGNKVNESKKSSNNYLSELKISNLEVNFNKENLEYTFEVENNVESINIEAKAEHDSAKVEGAGKQSLNIGENDIKVAVIAEDGSKKIYSIKIKRKDNNAYLANLKISNIDFEFNKKKLNYEIIIPRNLESVTVKGTAESKLATIDGLGNYKLLKEENTIKIDVTSEDKTVKTYTIVLKKEPKVMNLWIVAGISIVVLTIIIFVVIYTVKKRKKVNKKDSVKKKNIKSDKKNVD